MLLRGRNTVGYTPYPEAVTHAFVREATKTGIDIFRIFDALERRRADRPADRGGPRTGTAVAEVSLCITADRSDRRAAVHIGLLPEARRADRRRGAHILAVKDMALLRRRPPAG